MSPGTTSWNGRASVAERKAKDSDVFDYCLTDAGKQLKPVLMGIRNAHGRMNTEAMSAGRKVAVR